MVHTSKHVDHTRLTTSQLARFLGCSHEHARRLIHGSRIGAKNRSGYWSISQTWAEKFSRLGTLFRAEEDLERNDPERASGPAYDRNIIVIPADDEALKLVHANLAAIVGVFGSPPVVLGREDSAALRMVTAFRVKPVHENLIQALIAAQGQPVEEADKLIAPYRPKSVWWTEKLADAIDRAGNLMILGASK
jgi:hypothetical protein